MAAARNGPWRLAPRRAFKNQLRTLNVPADVYDLRDRVYNPPLRHLPSSYDTRHKLTAPICDQGELGACTGFAMATVVNYLLGSDKSQYNASPRFLYENAKRYDEWKGVEYEGSSIRGAMKGFLRHGVCEEEDAPYPPAPKPNSKHPFPPMDRRAYAAADQHPLGAYYRITGSSVGDLQCAILETGAILVSAQVHEGWNDPPVKPKGVARIPWKPGWSQDGGHAFALIGYDEEGFLVHNSWGRQWGAGGFAYLSYEDWLANGMDAWVAQMGVGSVGHNYPRMKVNVTERGFEGGERPVDESLIQGHYLAIRNGDFDEYGPIRTMPNDLDAIVDKMRTAQQKQAGSPLKVLIFAHGGLVGEAGASHKALALKQEFFDKAGIYSIHIIWHTAFLEEVVDIITGKQNRVALLEPGLARGVGEWLQNAADGTIEAAIRVPGRAVWDAMKEDAKAACPRVGELLDRISAARIQVEFHLAGHSAGSILHCHLLDEFARLRIAIDSMTFIAPAVSIPLFREKAMPRISSGLVRRFALHTMEDRDERSDQCGPLYHKSLLYLVSYSFEDGDSSRLLGLARNVQVDDRGSSRDADPGMRAWISQDAAAPQHELIFRRPVLERPGASLHGSFDDDPPTMQALLRRIAQPAAPAGLGAGRIAGASPKPVAAMTSSRRPSGRSRAWATARSHRPARS